MDKNELKNLDEEALQEKIVEFEKNLLNIRLQSSAQVKDVKQFRVLRLDIARAKTFLKEKQIKAARLSDI